MHSFTRRTVPLVLAAGLAGVACSSSSSGGQSPDSGTQTSLTFIAASSYAASGKVITSETTTSDGGLYFAMGGEALSVVLTNNAAVTCSLVQASAKKGAFYSNLDTLTLSLTNLKASVTAGTFTISASAGEDGTTAQADYLSSGAQCSGDTFTATSGSVTIDTVSATSVSGSYSLSLGTAGQATGSFDAKFCTVPAASDAGVPACIAP